MISNRTTAYYIFWICYLFISVCVSSVIGRRLTKNLAGSAHISPGKAYSVEFAQRNSNIDSKQLSTGTPKSGNAAVAPAGSPKINVASPKSTAPVPDSTQPQISAAGPTVTIHS
jgi:hypothetical protein